MKPILIHFDDEKNMREMYEYTAAQYKSIDFKGSFGNFEDFMIAIKENYETDSPIIALLDVTYMEKPDQPNHPYDGWDMAGRIFERFPDVKTVMYTGKINKNEYFRKGISANVSGYMFRVDLDENIELEKDLLSVLDHSSNDPYLRRGISKKRYYEVFRDYLQTSNIKDLLKPTQYKVMVALANGFSKKKIIKLGICLSANAFNTHTNEIRTMLTNIAISRGLLEKGETKIENFQVPYIAYKIGIPEVLDAYNG